MHELNYKLEGDIILVCKTKGYGYVIEGFEEDRKLFYRTCGLERICGYELEINLSLEPAEAKRILDDIVDNLLIGFKLEDCSITSELTGAPVYLKQYKSRYPKFDNEICYRVIFSDENYLLPMHRLCDEVYKAQLD